MSFSIKHGLFKYDLTDHYAILGMPINADTKQVRKQYLKIARSLHPDTVKGKSDSEKKQASELLSKLVNPAYEQLSKTNTQTEYELVLKQTGKRLAGETGKVSLESDVAKQLAKAPAGGLDAAYQTAVKQLAASQYDDLEKISIAIGHLSELNMVYLIRKQGKVAPKASAAGASPAKAAAGTADKTSTAPTPPPQPERTSPAEHYIRRAQEYINKKNYAKAVLELRDAIKLEPNNSTGHALLGLTYLKQNQATMAKVHINKAFTSNPKDPLAIQAKETLERITGQKPPAPKSQQQPAQPAKSSAQTQQKKGLFGGMFGGGKKK